jgi:hypothetical protein
MAKVFAPVVTTANGGRTKRWICRNEDDAKLLADTLSLKGHQILGFTNEIVMEYEIIDVEKEIEKLG